jgi:DNA mismatch repair protein MutS2
MRITSGETLEFESLKALIGRYLSSALGRRELAKARPLAKADRIRGFLDETAEALDYLRQATQPQPGARGGAIRLRFDAPSDIEQTVQKVRIEGARLDGKEIFDLCALLDRAGEARAQFSGMPDRFPILARRAEPIADFRPLLRDLSGKILPDGSLADDASVNLNRLRRDAERQQKAIHQSLERFMRKHKDDGTLQEEFVTIRNDRFVVPVVAGQQRKANGVIHGASNSGHTLFLEPLETIDLNNELVRLRDEEQAEVIRILAELTLKLRAHAHEIRYAVDAMGVYEFIFAKAQFGLDFQCCIPRLSPDEKRRLHFVDARHPLLEDLLRRQGKAVTPVSLTLDESNRTLLISGPNTGGKTVAMKTVGLLCLMAQSGFPVPCLEAEFPVCDQVLADIGDHQSIQESLSSFSAHVAGVKTMLESVTRDSLVLLDELGRATDPEEGGALGVAMLDSFRKAGSFTLASTHLLALKVYGSNTPGVVNASMGFNELTLQPTYVLRLGAPGKSAGLDIASRLGLPAELIEQARGLLSSNERDIAAFLSEIHAKLDSVAKLEIELKTQQQRLTDREAALEKDYAKKRDTKLQELEDKSRQLAAHFEQQAKLTIAEITQNVDQRKAAEVALRKVAKTRREFLEEVAVEVDAVKPATEKPRLKVEVGVRVKLKGIRQPARVRKVTGDRVDVEAGFMKMQVSFDDIEEILDKSDDPKPKGITFQQQGPAWDVVYSEVNVVGKHAEEAIDEVDKFLDRAAIAQVDRIRIVHGFGMGVLRKAIAKLLTTNPHVSRFYEASQTEGGGGATVVELK